MLRDSHMWAVITFCSSFPTALLGAWCIPISLSHSSKAVSRVWNTFTHNPDGKSLVFSLRWFPPSLPTPPGVHIVLRPRQCIASDYSFQTYYSFKLKLYKLGLYIGSDFLSFRPSFPHSTLSPHFLTHLTFIPSLISFTPPPSFPPSSPSLQVFDTCWHFAGLYSAASASTAYISASFPTPKFTLRWSGWEKSSPIEYVASKLWFSLWDYYQTFLFLHILTSEVNTRRVKFGSGIDTLTMEASTSFTNRLGGEAGWKCSFHCWSVRLNLSKTPCALEQKVIKSKGCEGFSTALTHS